MIRTTITETTEKYDKDGKLIEKITREETTEDDETRFPVSVPPYEPYNPNQVWYSQPYCYTTLGTDIGKSVEKIS